MFETRSYRVVEAALAAAYSIEQGHVPALRSRLGAFQRGGLFGTKPGKGVHWSYGPDQFRRLILALELSAWGVAPSLVLQLIEDSWARKLRPVFDAAESAITRETDDIVLVLVGGDRMFPSRRDAAGMRVTSAPLRDLPACMAAAMRDDPNPARAIVVNLSARLRRFHTALADAHDLSEPVLTKAAIRLPTRAKRKARRARNRNR